MQTFAPRGRIHGPILPQFVLETSISFGAKIMYALLCNYASDNDRCWPSQAKLAARLSCSVSSVKKYLAELVGIKLVHVRREQYRSSVYYMLEPAALKSVSQEANPACRQADSACPQPKVGYINTLNKQREIQNPPLPPVRSALPDFAASPLPSVSGGGGVSVSNFEKVWELYPKKEAKGLARSAWLRLQREGLLPPLSRIESSIRHFMTSETWQREQGRFVPQMSNWLKGQRWLDDDVMAAANEAEARQRSVAALQAMQQKEEANNAARAREREALRPRFDAFAKSFQIHDKPWIRPMAFGLWMHLHNTHRAPTPSDVPADNQLGIGEFLQAFKRRCEEAAWRKPVVPERTAQTAFGAFTEPRGNKLTAFGALLPHHPMFSRQPVSPALARAM
ncbi:MAG: helix-turn-helix domain-containing protein [Desulfovibrio sp.]|jgi:hypothetical protein|nr:helix-turn-helix domain-containing protein [Desulfovibrio sp.]